jgi:hypothetical protein
MPSYSSLFARAAALLVLPAAALLTAPALAATPATATKPASETQALLKSRLLWSTIDVCNAADQPNTIGVRGSMPGDGQAHDTMYMRFRLQYMSPTAKRWVDLIKGAASSFVSVGTGASPRQGGRSFQLGPATGQPAFAMRGVVSFQWRQGTTVLASVSRPTSAGRQSLAGADPAGFSTATCQIG